MPSYMPLRHELKFFISPMQYFLLSQALDRVLQRDVPVIGVIKGEGPAGKLIEKLGLTEEYEAAARNLRQRLQTDEHTLVYTCGQYDACALELAQQWAARYIL